MKSIVLLATAAMSIAADADAFAVAAASAVVNGAATWSGRDPSVVNLSSERRELVSLSQSALMSQMPSAGASRTGNRVSVELPQKGLTMVTAVIDAQTWTGKVIRAVILAQGRDVARAEQHWYAL